MPLSRRYTPEHAPGDDYTYGMDYSFVIPPGVGIKTGSLEIWENVVPAVPSTDFTIGAVSVRGRAVYADLSGGSEGTDYQLRWNAIDTDGKSWFRTALLLCAQTS